MSTENNEFAERPLTETRYDYALRTTEEIIIVTRAYGPNGEDLMDTSDHRFSGEVGVRLKVRQGDVEDEVVLSPFFGDPSKLFGDAFESGKRCELFVPGTDTPLDRIPGMTTPNGGQYYALYLSPKLGDGELVAINDVWNDPTSRMVSEGELLVIYAELEDAARANAGG